MADSIVGRLIYKISGDLTDIQKSLKNAEKTVGRFTQFVKSAAGLFGAAAAFKTLIGIGRDSVQAFAESEAAGSRLANALRLTGEGGTDAADNISRLAAELQKTTAYEDDLTTSAAATLISMTGMSSAMAMQLIPQMQNYATLMGVDLVSAAQQFGQFFEGGRNPFAKIGIEVAKDATLTEKYNILLEGMAKRFGDMASQGVGPTVLSVSRFHNAMGDLKEMLGAEFAEGARPAMDYFSNLVAKMKEAKQQSDDLSRAIETDITRRTAQQNVLMRQNDILELQQKRYDLMNQAMIASGEAQQKLLEEVAQVDKEIAEAEKDIPKLEAIRDHAAKVVKERMEAEDKARAAKEALVRTINAEIEAGGKLIAQKEEEARKAVETTAREAQEEKEVQALIVEGRRNAAEAVAAYVDARFEAGKRLIAEKDEEIRKTKEAAAAAVAAEQEIQALVAEGRANAEEYRRVGEQLMRDQIRQTQEEMRTVAMTVTDAITQVLGAIISTSQQMNRLNLNKELDAVNAAEQAELDAVDAAYAEKNGMMTEAQAAELAAEQAKEQQKEDIRRKYDKQRAQIQYQAALRSWELEFQLGLVSASRAVLAGFATPPFIPAGLIAGALAASLSAIELDAIQKAKPVEPNLARGGSFTVPPGYPDDSFHAGLSSGEEVEVRPYGAGKVERHLHFDLNGKEIAHFIEDEIDKGRILVRQRSIRR